MQIQILQYVRKAGHYKETETDNGPNYQLMIIEWVLFLSYLISLLFNELMAPKSCFRVFCHSFCYITHMLIVVIYVRNLAQSKDLRNPSYSIIRIYVNYNRLVLIFSFSI